MTGFCPKPIQESPGHALGMPFALVAAVVDSPKLYELKSASILVVGVANYVEWS